MRRFKFNYLFVGFLGVFLLMNHSAFAQNTTTTDFVIHYKNEFTLGLCLFVLVLSSWLGMRLPTENNEQDLSKGVKFVTALLGGVLAFIYCLYKDKSLTLLNPIWIFAASLALPVTILNLRAKFKEYTNIIKIPKSGD